MVLEARVVKVVRKAVDVVERMGAAMAAMMVVRKAVVLVE
jgi:hypothetical protein